MGEGAASKGLGNLDLVAPIGNRTVEEKALLDLQTRIGLPGKPSNSQGSEPHPAETPVDDRALPPHLGRHVAPAGKRSPESLVGKLGPNPGQLPSRNYLVIRIFAPAIEGVGQLAAFEALYHIVKDREVTNATSSAI